MTNFRIYSFAHLAAMCLVLITTGPSAAQTATESIKSFWNNTKKSAIQEGRKAIPHSEIFDGLIQIEPHAGTKIRKGDFRQNRSNPPFNPSDTRFAIAGNLYVDIAGHYPTGYQPSWKYIGAAAPLTFQAEQYIARNTITPTDSRAVGLGDYRGRASVVFGAFISCMCIADIIIKDSFNVLTEKPQTFQLTNFRKFADGVATGDKCQGLNNIYTAGGFEGKITLSANRDGDILMDLMIENYRLADRFSPAGVSYRYTANQVAMDNEMSAEKANALVAKELADKQRRAEYVARSNAQLTTLYKTIAKKYPGYDCRSCIHRNIQPNLRGTPYYYERSGEYAKTEYDLTGEITIENICHQKLTIVGIRQMHDDVKGYYFVDVAKTMSADYRYNVEHTVFSYLATSVLGMNEDFTIQNEYNLQAASVGSIQWIKVVGARKP